VAGGQFGRGRLRGAGPARYPVRITSNGRCRVPGRIAGDPTYTTAGGARRSVADFERTARPTSSDRHPVGWLELRAPLYDPRRIASRLVGSWPSGSLGLRSTIGLLEGDRAGRRTSAGGCFAHEWVEVTGVGCPPSGVRTDFRCDTVDSRRSCAALGGARPDLGTRRGALGRPSQPRPAAGDRPAGPGACDRLDSPGAALLEVEFPARPGATVSMVHHGRARARKSRRCRPNSGQLAEQPQAAGKGVGCCRGPAGRPPGVGRGRGLRLLGGGGWRARAHGRAESAPSGRRSAPSGARAARANLGQGRPTAADDRSANRRSRRRRASV